MAERFDAYYDSISCKSTGRHIHADGEFVLASDYAALESELARVKAESLRVVADGEQCAVEIIPTGLRVAIHGRQGIFRRVGSGAAANPLRIFLLFEDCHSGNEIEVEYGSLGTPVRLERWEDE